MGRKLKPANLAAKRVADLVAEEAPAIRKAPAQVEKQLGASVPVSVYRQLRLRAAESGTTVRGVLLDALARAGYDVPPEAMGDLRAPKKRG